MLCFHTVIAKINELRVMNVEDLDTLWISKATSILFDKIYFQRISPTKKD